MSERSVGSRSMGSRRFAAALGALLLGIGSAHAIEITIGGKQIKDGDPEDLDGLPNIIRFDSANQQGGRFALPAGSSVSTISGVVRRGGTPGGLVQILGAPSRVVTLTEFKATRVAGAGNAPLDILFGESFARPRAANIVAADAIQGELKNTVLGVNVFGDSVTWQGLVDNVPISPPAVTIATPAAPGVQQQMPVFGSHLPQSFPVAGNVALVGKLSITLGGPNHELNLPDSADVGFREAPEPLLTRYRAGIGFIFAVLLAVFAFALVRSKRQRSE